MLLGIPGGLLTAWFVGEPHISQGFAYLDWAQRHPPTWLEAPEVGWVFLLLPTVVLLLLASGIKALSPRPRPWSRSVVVVLLLLLLGRYLVWRSLSTLSLADPLNGTFSLILLGMEWVCLFVNGLQLVLILHQRDRYHQADQYEVAVRAGHYCPSVAVLIPTYDEPAFILRRTVIGCQAMDYGRKTIYLLDDTRRPEIQALAAELGCHYLSRPDNRHAKAGNLNYAIAHTQSDLIACFDADFVPTRNFLQRTVGFFQNPRIGLVQTPQSFYSPDPIARNLGLENQLPPDEEFFYRHIQSLRDGIGSVVCSGTSFVIRRCDLEAVGGFVTESISEDYFTAVRLAALGQEVVYLGEKLSAGLAAETISAFATQRLRWARGTLQAFFIDSNPLTIPGLTLIQRLGHLEGILNWFLTIPRIAFLFMPMVYVWFGVIPLQASAQEFLYFFVPFYLVQTVFFAWLNHQSRSALLSDVASLVLVFPIAATVFRSLLRPFAQGFTVTPKGTSSDRWQFNSSLAWPLLLVLGLTLVSLGRYSNLEQTTAETGNSTVGLQLGWIWLVYNLLMLSIALLVLLDRPRPQPHLWFQFRYPVNLKPIPRPSSPGESASGESASRLAPLWQGQTTLLSEVGACIVLPPSCPNLPRIGDDPLAVLLEIPGEHIRVPGQLRRVGQSQAGVMVQVKFCKTGLHHQRQLIPFLFCRPGQWPEMKTPGEIQALVMLIKLLLRPPLITYNPSQISALAIAKGS